jgi:hypothetical protein
LEYATHKHVGLVGLLLVAAFETSPGWAEHAPGASPFGGGFPWANPPASAPPVVNDGRSLVLPSAPSSPGPGAAAAPPETREEFRVTGASISGRQAIAPTPALASPFAQGYNAPSRSGSPSELVPYGGRIGLSRVPRSALSPLPPSAVQ